MIPNEGNVTLRLLGLTEKALEANDLDEMLTVMAGELASLANADACYLTFWDRDRNLVIPAGAWGASSGNFLRLCFEPDEVNITRAIAVSDSPVTMEEAAESPYGNTRLISGLNVRSFIGLPLRSADQVLGAIIIAYMTPRHLPEDLVGLCIRAARIASFSISKMRLLEEERKRSDELEALNNIGIAISASRDIDRTITAIFEQCRSIIDLDTFYIALYDEEKHELSFPLFHDGGARLRFESRNIRDNPGLSGHIIRTRTSICLPDASTDEMHDRYGTVRAGGAPARAYMGAPLLNGDRVIGVISIQSYEANVYTPHHLQLLETIAAQSAIAIQNARLNEELQLLSITDGLTGAYNYRHLSELGPREFAIAHRYNRPVSLIFIDIDKFRDFNSRYGHATGNEVLKSVTTCARGCIREIDIFSRYGGEEFVIVLPETPADEAMSVGERLRAAIEAMRLRVSGIDEDLHVTISVGVATSAPGMDSFQTLVELANGAERRAKRRGRNRVEVAG